jgi:uncharacterized protein YdeI (YjbR/CyaY-like superfamily)
MEKSGNQPKNVVVKDRSAWRQWLEKNHATSTSAWLVVNKKNSRKSGVTVSGGSTED